jgi:hypothetical protein
MTFYIVTAWKNKTVLAMHIVCQLEDAHRLCASLSRRTSTAVKQAARFTVEGPWKDGEDLSSEDRVFCTMYPD